MMNSFYIYPLFFFWIFRDAAIARDMARRDSDELKSIRHDAELAQSVNSSIASLAFEMARRDSEDPKSIAGLAESINDDGWW